RRGQDETPSPRLPKPRARGCARQALPKEQNAAGRPEIRAPACSPIQARLPIALLRQQGIRKHERQLPAQRLRREFPPGFVERRRERRSLLLPNSRARAPPSSHLKAPLAPRSGSPVHRASRPALQLLPVRLLHAPSPQPFQQEGQTRHALRAEAGAVQDSQHPTAQNPPPEWTKSSQPRIIVLLAAATQAAAAGCDTWKSILPAG